MVENHGGNDLLDTTDCLEAVGVFKGWKNFLFLVILLCLLVLQVSFYLVDRGYINIGGQLYGDEPAVEAPTERADEGPPDMSGAESSSVDPEELPIKDEPNESNEPIEDAGPVEPNEPAQPDEAVEVGELTEPNEPDELTESVEFNEPAEPSEAVDVAEQPEPNEPAEPNEVSEPNEPADPNELATSSFSLRRIESKIQSTAPRMQYAGQWIPKDFMSEITFEQLTLAIRLVNAVLLLTATLYCLTMLFSLKVSMNGRLGGINHISRAFFLSLLMLVLLLPWQQVFGSVVSGAMFTPEELAKAFSGKTDDILDIVLYYLRFSAYGVLILLLLILSQLRSLRWAKAILRRLEII